MERSTTGKPKQDTNSKRSDADIGNLEDDGYCEPSGMLDRPKGRDKETHLSNDLSVRWSELGLRKCPRCLNGDPVIIHVNLGMNTIISCACGSCGLEWYSFFKYTHLHESHKE